MAFNITMEDDGILRISLSGIFDKFDAESLSRKLDPFIDASTENDPINIIFSPELIEKLTSKGRKYLTDLHKDSRIGNSAIINPPRSILVLVRFIMQATNKENIAFFDDEASAYQWIKSSKSNQKSNLQREKYV